MKRRCLSALFMALMFSAFGQDYHLSFETTDNNYPIESVTIQNLTQKEEITIGAGENLIIGEGSGVNSILNVESKFSVYPNPSRGESTVSFVAAKSATMQVRLIDLMGRVVAQSEVLFEAGPNELKLSEMPNNFYIVSIEGEGQKISGRIMVSGSFNSGLPKISMADKSEFKFSPLQSAPVTRSESEQRLKYKKGDILKYTVHSGENYTIITDSPTESTTIKVVLTECKDGDGNNYGIVKIGELYFMASNLRSSKAKDGSALPMKGAWTSVTNNSITVNHSVYDNNPSNIDTFGYLYTYGAAETALPEGFVIPTEEDMKSVITTLGGDIFAPSQLKAPQTWTNPAGANNQSGFALLAGGGVSGTNGAFANMGSTARLMLSDGEANYTHRCVSISNQVVYETVPYIEGLSVRGVFRPKSKLLNNIFGSKIRQETPKNGDATPLGNYHTFTSNKCELMLISRKDGEVNSLTPGIGFWESKDESKTDAKYLSGEMDNIDASSNKWWFNIHKAAPIMRNDGKQDLVVAVWDESKPFTADYLFNTNNANMNKRITLKVIRRNSKESNKLSIAASQVMDETYNLYQKNNIQGGGAAHEIIESLDLSWDMTTGDIDQDGQDEIIIAIRNKVCAYKFDGTSFSTMPGFPLDLLSDHNNTTADKMLYWYTNVKVADIDKNGKNDLMVMTSSRHSSYGPMFHVYLDGDVKDANRHINQRLEHPNGTDMSEWKSGTFTVDDIDKDGYNDLLVNLTYTANWTGYNLLTYYKYDIANKRFKISKDSFAVQGGSGSISAADSNSPVSVIKTARFDGPAGFVYIIFGNGCCYYDLATGKLKAAGNGRLFYFDNYCNEGIYGNQIAVGNFDNDPSGRESVYCIRKQMGWEGRSIWGIFLMKVKMGVNGIVACAHQATFDQYKGLGAVDGKYCMPTITAVNTRSVSPKFEYVGYETKYTMPIIESVLCAAPYYKEAMPTASIGTSWGKSVSSGTTTDNNYSNGLSIIAGYNQEFSVFGQKVAGIELTTKATLDFSSGFTTTTETVYSTTFTGADEDAVVLNTIPHDTYHYRVLTAEDPRDIGSIISFSFPRTKVQMMVPVQEYNDIVSPLKIYPTIGTDVLTHTVGVPSSYPRDYTGLSNVVHSASTPKIEMSATDFLRVGTTGSVEQGIEVSKATGNTNSFTWGLEVELVSSVANAKFGAGYNHSETSSVTVNTSNSQYVGGCVPSIPSGSPAIAKQFDWKLIWYNYKKNDIVFQIVNYAVRP